MSPAARTTTRRHTRISEDDSIPVPPKLAKWFYEVVVVLKAFDTTRGDHIRRPERFSADEDHTSQELRRSFIDSIAYVCDSEKGGKTATAAFLQQTPQGVLIWLAANQGLGKTTVDDLKQVLSNALGNFNSKKPFGRVATLAKLVQMNQPR